MATRRIILHKTHKFEKGVLDNRRGRHLEQYLARYADEIAKAKQRSEKWANNPGTPVFNKHVRLPEDASGILHSEGIFGHIQSPGGYLPKNQCLWIKQFSESWYRALSLHPNRANDGFRYVFSLSEQAVRHLNATHQSADQALREIWKHTVYLYRKQHGWLDPKDTVTWIAASHHDTNNPHLHVTLFPVTKSGQQLRTHNARRARGEDNQIYRIHDMNDFNAIANQAAEIWWRERMPIQFQDPDYIQAVTMEPTLEPELPSLSDYPACSGFNGSANNEAPAKKKTKQPDRELPVFRKQTRQSIRNLNEVTRSLKNTFDLKAKELKASAFRLHGVLSLKAMTSILSTWDAKQKKSYPSLLVAFWNKQKTASIVKGLQNEFPIEADALKRLYILIDLLKLKSTKQAIRDVIGQRDIAAHILTALIAGSPSDPPVDTCMGFGRTLAQVHEAENPDNYRQNWDRGTKHGKHAQDEVKRCALYRSILADTIRAERRLELDLSDAKALLESIIRGSERVQRTSQAKHKESRSTLRWTKNGILPRLEIREWAFENNDWIVRTNQGRPWPEFLDPQTCIKPLQAEQVAPPIPAVHQLEILRSVKLNAWQDLARQQASLFREILKSGFERIVKRREQEDITIRASVQFPSPLTKDEIPNPSTPPHPEDNPTSHDPTNPDLPL